MAISRLDAKGVLLGIKNGMTVDDFCTKYQCSSEELITRIHQIYSRSEKFAKKHIAAIIANEKNARKTPNATEDAEADGAGLAEETPVELPEVDWAEATNEASAETNAETQDETCSETALERAEKEAEALSQEVMDIEVKWRKEFTPKHLEFIAELREINAEMKELIARYKKLCSRYESTVEKDNAVIQQMNELMSVRREKMSRLAEVRQRIVELKAVSLCIYDSGEIATLDERDIVLDDSGYLELYNELLEREECQELRLKDIRALARLICIVRNMGDISVSACVFDNDELEKVYQMLSA